MLLFLTIHAIKWYLFKQSRPLVQNQLINNYVRIKLNTIQSIVDLFTKSSHHIDNKAIRDGKYLAPPHASAWQRSPH